ncbi:hypothetical protein [Alcaligenes sp.]|uniref:hypothetical protein n=1 Tax=Alcaligenes sp. TaxID=512 RepID=UPI003CFEC532
MTEAYSLYRIIKLALGGVSISYERDVPTPELVCHDGVSIGDYECLALPLIEQGGARALVLHAWEFAKAHFPFGARIGEPQTTPLRVTRIDLGRAPNCEEIVSASSPQLPGFIQIGVPDKRSYALRISSLLVHESMHQALYLREIHSKPFIENALGYSPWKKRLRSARLVWHSWWTFAVQYAYLIQILSNEPSIIEVDPGLVKFTAERKAELEIAFFSIRSCNTFLESEASACLEAATLVDTLTENASCVPGFARAYELAAQSKATDFSNWIHSLDTE